MSNTFDKLSVLDSFIEEVNSYLPGIETNLERLAQSPGDMDALEETYRLTHTIGGSASMMDFPGLAHVAHGMEDILGDALDGLISLNGPAFGLLQRSLSRLYRLLNGIHNGIDEEAVIAEDDADYTHYRSLTDTPGSAGQEVEKSGADFVDPAVLPSSPSLLQSLYVPSSMPSFDEVLASFRTPAIEPGEDVAWPEEPALAPQFNASPVPSALVVPEWLSEPEPFLSGQSSALEALVASTRRPLTSSSDLPTAPSIPTPAVTLPLAQEEMLTFMSSTTPSVPAVNSYVSDLSPYAVPENDAHFFPQLYSTMQNDVRTIEVQASSLKDVLVQLRDAIEVVEEQRSEFKGFLDGSKDALDRMENWAGQAMGLNLRNSPEQVRRYLPLSVMWVSNSKLKKVLDLLQQVTGGMQLTDEQTQTALQQLHISIQSWGEAFQQTQMQASQSQSQEAGWSPWEMRRDADAVRERVTFERQGDIATLRTEIEARLREELRQEQSAQPPWSLLRAELEQQVREDVRREYEDRLQLQASASNGNSNNGEALRELESRLRSEIEIQVRQDFLNQITRLGGDLTSLQSQQETVRSADFERSQGAQSLKTVIPSGPTPRPAPAPASNSAPPIKHAPQAPYGGDIGEEATEVFRLEAEEHLQTISMNVASLEKNPENRDFIQGIRRATHTLKGAAAMMGFRAIADLCHISEDLLDMIMEGNTTISSPILSIILDTTETLDILVTGRGSTANDETLVHILQVRYSELLGERAPSQPLHEEDLDDYHVDEHQQTEVVSETQPSADKSSGQRELSVRVRLQRLDELVNLFGELLVNRSVLEERIQRIVRLVADVGVSSNRLADVGQKLDSRFEAATLPSGHSVQVMPGEGNQGFSSSSSNSTTHTNGSNGRNTLATAHLSDFDELELDRYTEFHQLARGLSEGISDMTTLSAEMEGIIRECESVFARENRLTTTFQDRLMKARLVPLSSMVPRLYRTARAVAFKQGKDLELILEGETTEVDRTVYEELFGPLLHLVRNAVNHALETPDVRLKKGKPAAGQIKLSASYEGNQIVITVRDDGTGIDQDRVRNSAIARGLVRADQSLTENDLVSLIFHPGFSTAEVLSEESGRGVGLDVVRDSVSRLRGTLAVESTPGQGTAFTMTFPTSLAIQSVMMVKAGDQQFAMPTVHIESIGRLDNFKRSTLGGQPAVVVRSELYPLYSLAQYLSLPENMIEDKAQILIVNAGGQRVALLIDEIKGKTDIVMKNLGPHLREVHGIAGATVLGNGLVVLVLEMNSLISSRAASMAAISTRKDAPISVPASARQHTETGGNRSSGGSSVRPGAPHTANSERGKHILVVDDSPSVRRVVSNMLKQHGWEVMMARDGVEALEMISAQTPAAVLLDIEMPRMDGYELTSTIRAQEQYRNLPLIVLTSRAASKHQQRALALGANSYVVKPYQDEELLNTINSLVFGASTR